MIDADPRIKKRKCLSLFQQMPKPRDCTRIVKLCDFGLSKMYEELDAEASRDRAGGTKGFYAPELCKTTIIGHPTLHDIFSFGMVLYCMLTVSFRGCGPGSPINFPLECSISLIELINHCCQQAPHKRPGAIDVIRHLRLIRSSYDTQDTQQGDRKMVYLFLFLLLQVTWCWCRT